MESPAARPLCPGDEPQAGLPARDGARWSACPRFRSWRKEWEGHQRQEEQSGRDLPAEGLGDPAEMGGPRCGAAGCSPALKGTPGCGKRSCRSAPRSGPGGRAPPRSQPCLSTAVTRLGPLTG